ncbi:hypothetical protein R69746_05919 [Paraburkholderia aspalathi]|nr:hypothetical protein R69746_05919 [Paraburkholderia aspalathi]
MTTGASSPPFYFVLRTSFSLLIAPSTYVLMLTHARPMPGRVEYSLLNERVYGSSDSSGDDSVVVEIAASGVAGQ